MKLGQEWDSQDYKKHARFVPDLGMPVVEWLNPVAGERILDLGCGDGALTVKLAALGCTVVGADSSSELVGAAKSRGIDARLMDGEQLQFEAEFNAVFSNAALHWMKRPDAVIIGVWRALIPGGRFVGELGGSGNVKTIINALYKALARRGIDPSTVDPWYFPTAEDYQRRLEASGFQVSRISLFQRPTPLPTDMRGWLRTFGQCFMAALPLPEQPGFISEVCETLQPELCDYNGQWIADYMRLRFEARKL